MVILDLNMPEMRGDAVLKIIKAFSPNTPVIILTGDAIKPDDPKLAQADGVVLKSDAKALEKILLQLLPKK